MILSILQWNIWYKEPIENISRFLKENPADVICLQELTIRGSEGPAHAPNYIAEQLGYHHYFQEIDLGDDKIKLANGIFSRYPIIASKTHWINEPTGTGHYDDEWRAYIEVTLQMEDAQITVGTTHMSYTNAFASTPRKTQETAKLADILKTKHEKFVITGDFNAAPGSPTINAVNGILENIGPDFSQNTWTTKPFSYDGFEETELNWRLDYIFATQDVKTISAKVLHTEYSDHLPVWAEVQI